MFISNVCNRYWNAFGRIIAICALHHLSMNVLAKVLDETTRLLGTSITGCVAIGVATIVINIILVRCYWNKAPSRRLYLLHIRK